MRNRLNVNWQGSRTTARFPSELWAIALNVYDYDESRLKSDLSQMLAINEKPSMASYTASGIVRQCLLHIAIDALNPAGFDPG